MRDRTDPETGLTPDDMLDVIADAQVDLAGIQTRLRATEWERDRALAALQQAGASVSAAVEARIDAERERDEARAERDRLAAALREAAESLDLAARWLHLSGAPHSATTTELSADRARAALPGHAAGDGAAKETK